MFKKTTSALFVLTMGILALSSPARAGSLPESLVPEGASWIAHLDMEKFVATELFKVLDSDGRIEIKSRDIGRMMKIDFFKDVSGLTIFGFAPGGKRVVSLVAGRFDKKRMLTVLDLSDDYQEIPYGGNTIYSTDDDEFGAFVNDGLIVFGERREDIEKVLDTAAGKAKSFASSGLNASFKSIAPGAFLCGAFDDLAGLDREFSESRFLSKAKGLFFLAQEKQDRLLVRLQVTADTAENATDMAEIAQGLLAMARLSRKEGPSDEAAFLADGVVVKQDGLKVRLELDVPVKDVSALMSHHGRGVASFLN